MAEAKSDTLEFTVSVDEEIVYEKSEMQQEINAAATLDIDENKDGLHTFTDFPPSAVDEEIEEDSDRAELLKKKSNPVWSFAFYQEFFNINTSTVLSRIKGSVMPIPSYGLHKTDIKGRPDMYGPFWICATLVICIGVFGNLSNLLKNSSNPNYHYVAQFQLFPFASVIFYCYTFVIPLFLRALFWWRKNAAGLTISQLICIYGYSLFPLIPLSVLLLVPYDTFDWIVVSVTALLSGIVIIISLWPAFDNDNRKLAAVFLFLVFALHAAMIVLLKLYFFSYEFLPDNSENATTFSVEIYTTFPSPI